MGLSIMSYYATKHGDTPYPDYSTEAAANIEIKTSPNCPN
jgi:hypothetical protein